MKKSIYSINEMHNAIKQIVKQINISGFNPEVIVSINRGGCIPGVYLSHFVKKTFNDSDCEIRFAALINNLTSKTKIDYHGQLIDKSKNPVWYVFPWENWW